MKLNHLYDAEILSIIGHGSHGEKGLGSVQTSRSGSTWFHPVSQKWFSCKWKGLGRTYSPVHHNLRNRRHSQKLLEEAFFYFKLPAQTSKLFETYKEIDDSAQYWRPTSKVHSTCDAYIPEKGIVLQMMIGPEHTINMDGLRRDNEQVNIPKAENEHPGEPLKLVFVIDTSVYTQFENNQTFKFPQSSKKANAKRTKGQNGK